MVTSMLVTNIGDEDQKQVLQQKKTPNKNLEPSDKRDKIVEVTRESYSEYSEAWL